MSTLTTVDASIATSWEAVAPLACIQPNTGVAALIRGQQMALVRVSIAGQDMVYALDNLDPFSGAMVIARGIVGDRNGVTTIASPIYKQAFDVRTGICCDTPTIVLRTYPARIREQHIELNLGNRNI